MKRYDTYRTGRTVCVTPIIEGEGYVGNMDQVDYID